MSEDADAELLPVKTISWQDEDGQWWAGDGAITVPGLTKQMAIAKLKEELRKHK